ncbi:MAG: hypothetical protein Q8L10_02850 [Candidatus Moranbacteria bacterium]|nr:hypothetical protein [Candidatus Moranbacteria bacterium]
MTEKRFFVSIGNRGDENPIGRELRRIISASDCRLVVDRPEEADVIVTDSPSEALGLLEKYGATVVIAILLGSQEEEDARAVKEVHKRRVIIAPIDRGAQKPGDKDLVSYLTDDTPKRIRRKKRARKKRAKTNPGSVRKPAGARIGATNG